MSKSEVKWTPGPWAALVDPDSKHRTLISANAMREGESVNGGIYVAVAQGPDNRANARLIAAAPALVEAIEGMLRWRLPHDRAFTVTDGSRAAFDKLVVALASARGEQA